MGWDQNINKMVIEQVHLQHLQVSKDMSTMHHYRGISQTLSRNATYWVKHPKWLYTNVCSIGNRQGE